jgi:hypothetical protein
MKEKKKEGQGGRCDSAGELTGVQECRRGPQTFPQASEMLHNRMTVVSGLR